MIGNFGSFGTGLAQGFLTATRMGGRGFTPAAVTAPAPVASPMPVAKPAMPAAASAVAPQPAAGAVAPSQPMPVPKPAETAPTAAPAAPGSSLAPTAAPRMPEAKPDGMVWAEGRAPGDRLLMVPRSALRPGERSFAVSENTIGAGRGIPGVDARTTTPAAATMAAPVEPVSSTPIEAPMPVPKPTRIDTMGGPTARNGPRGDTAVAEAATDTLNGGAGGDDLSGGGGSDTLMGSSGSDKMGKGFRVGDPVAGDLPPHARAMLNAIAGGESGGRYDIRYTPSGGATFSGYDSHPGIMEPGPHGKSSAAGRYQFTKSTWNAMGGGAFSPEMQDRRAWELAQRDYRARTGGNLDADLRERGLTADMMKALAPTWQAFKGNHNRHAATYAESLTRYGMNAPTAGGVMADAGVGGGGRSNEVPPQATPAAAPDTPFEERRQAALERAAAPSDTGTDSGGSGAPAAPAPPPVSQPSTRTPDMQAPQIAPPPAADMAGTRALLQSPGPTARPRLRNTASAYSFIRKLFNDSRAPDERASA